MKITMFMVRAVMEITRYENNNVYGSCGHENSNANTSGLRDATANTAVACALFPFRTRTLPLESTVRPGAQRGRQSSTPSTACQVKKQRSCCRHAGKKRQLQYRQRTDAVWHAGGLLPCVRYAGGEKSGSG